MSADSVGLKLLYIAEVAEKICKMYVIIFVGMVASEI